jgi:hypothetical protein
MIEPRGRWRLFQRLHQAYQSERIPPRPSPATQSERQAQGCGHLQERGGNSVPAVFHSESQASAFIRVRIAKGTGVHADEAGSWDNLHERFEVKRINHQEAYSLDGACTNWAEEYFSRLRRAEVGIHHHIAGAYLLRYAQESSWREDNRRVSNGDQVSRVAALAMKRGKSVGFTGYWQRHIESQVSVSV